MYSNPTIPTIGTLLGVWAHPDDEAYLSSGLMALLRRHGQRVVVVTATDGEAGETTLGTHAPSSLAAVRRRELAASLAALGVHEHHRFGLDDGRLSRLPLATGAALVGELIDAVRPDTIVTFGPDGMTGHPDHRAVSAWATAAWTARRRGRLWYATLTPAFHQRWNSLNRIMSIFPDDSSPPETERSALALEIHCRGELLERKLHALRSHASQVEPLIAAVGADTFADWWAEEAFVDAATVIDTATVAETVATSPIRWVVGAGPRRPCLVPAIEVAGLDAVIVEEGSSGVAALADFAVDHHTPTGQLVDVVPE
jgi:LmbE family N-acetylglucosaminyl deacetylase